MQRVRRRIPPSAAAAAAWRLQPAWLCGMALAAACAAQAQPVGDHRAAGDALDALSGAAEAVTLHDADPGEAALAARVQQPKALPEGRISWGRSFGDGLDVRVSVSGLQARSDAPVFDFGAAGVAGAATRLDGERSLQFFGRVVKGAWSIEHVDGTRRPDPAAAGFLADPLVAGPDPHDRTTSTQLQYQDGYAGDTLQVSARAFSGRQREGGGLSPGTALRFAAASDWSGWELRLLSTAVGGHKLTVGAGVRHHTRIDQATPEPAMAADQQRIGSPGVRTGLVLQDEWRVHDQLTATLGLRLDHEAAVGTLSPRAALLWRAKAGTTFKALYGRGHRASHAGERDDDGLAQTGSRWLRGDTIDTLEMVADHQVGQELGLRAAVYQRTLHDRVTPGIDRASNLWQVQSGATIEARGLQLSADKAWDSGARLRGSIAVQDVRQAGVAPQAHMSALLARARLSAALPWAGLRIGCELRSDSRCSSVDGSERSGCLQSSLHIRTAALALGLELSLAVADSTDQRSAEPSALEPHGRSVRVEAGLRF